MKDIRIIFMGTPDFAVYSLRALVEAGYDILAVVTAPDRPAGRGRELRASPVKKYALTRNIPVLQPDNLKAPDFIDQLNGYAATLFVVVAFRMLPEKVWSMPPLGTFNLHASLLPQYRGAAPINRTIMNGEKQGGVTTFFLRHAIDTGNIIYREKITIAEDTSAGEYHDKLMKLGAKLVIRTVEAIKTGSVTTSEQSEFIAPGELLKTAPKISKEDCRIDWTLSAREVYNHIRGLSPYPGAFTELELPSGKSLYLKIFKSSIKNSNSGEKPGTILSDHKTFFEIQCADACISILELQQSGKRRMNVHDFLLGLNASMLG